MTSSAPPSPAKKPRTGWRRIAKRAAFAGLGLLVVIIVVFFLLPVWISNEQGRTYVLERINARLAADRAGGAALKLAIADWSLGWFRGTDLKEVQLSLPDGTVLLASPHVQSGLTLWDLLWGSYDLRSTTIDDLRMDIVRYADGRTSADGLMSGLAAALPTMRGAVQVRSGRATVTSVLTGQSVSYDVRATVTIASTDAPFHVQLSGMSAGNPGIGDGGPRDVSLSATVPAVGSWRRGRGAAAWDYLSDIEFSATNIPTGLVCDYLGMDPRWTGSIGDYLVTVRFSNHADAAQQTGRPELIVRGGGGEVGERYVFVRLLLRYGPRGAVLSLPEGAEVRTLGSDADFRAEASLRVSPPLAELLKRVNPIFAELKEGDGALRVRGAALEMPLEDLTQASGDVRMTFPGLVFVPRREGLVGQLLALTSDAAAPASLPARVGPLHLQLQDGRMIYDNATLTVAAGRINLSGTVGLDGTLDLVASLPRTGGGLGSETARVAVRGTVDAPRVERAK